MVGEMWENKKLKKAKVFFVDITQNVLLRRRDVRAV